jgi:hypothetical protein
LRIDIRDVRPNELVQNEIQLLRNSIETLNALLSEQFERLGRAEYEVASFHTIMKPVISHLDTLQTNSMSKKVD